MTEWRITSGKNFRGKRYLHLLCDQELTEKDLIFLSASLMQELKSRRLDRKKGK